MLLSGRPEKVKGQLYDPTYRRYSVKATVVITSEITGIVTIKSVVVGTATIIVIS